MTKRDYHVDLFRIIATIFVTMLHVLGQGGILNNAVPDGINYWVAWLLEIFAYCAVNCFALISGYVMINKTVKIKNVLKLWFQVLFYSLIFAFLFFLFVPETRTAKNLVVAFFPVFGKQWWYISSYFGLLLFIPILNTSVHNLSQKMFRSFLIIVLIGIGVFDCIMPIDALVLNNGYSPIWLIILYLFGAYIKKYDLKIKITAWKSLLFFVVMVVLTFLSKLVIRYATRSVLGDVKLDDTFISYISIALVLASVFLFLFCLNVKIGPFFQKAVHLFAPATLGVYLIHAHPFVFDYIIKDAFDMVAHKHAVIVVLCVLTATLSIFLLCSAIDLIRIQLFKLIRINSFCEIIDDKISRLYIKVFRE